MPLISLDHVNLRTTRLAVMRAFYEQLPGLRAGPRPPFSFGGAWIYCGERAVIHLVEVGDVDGEPHRGALALEHFAFAAVGLRAFVDTLRASNIAYRIGIVPHLGTRQVNICDPDGNHLHVDFAADEPALDADPR